MTIRRQPTDFRVQERLEPTFAAALQPEPSKAAPHAVYTLHKTSLTTPEAITQLARALGTPSGGVEYGGLKDKHAHTTQHVSVAATSAAQASKIPASATGPEARWTAERIGWSPEPMSAKAIATNRFTLVVRDLARAESDEMARRARLLAPDPGTSLCFTNYFGAQRFGSARHGQGWIAEKLIAGDFEGALKLAIATPARKDTGKTRTFTRAAATHWGDWKKLSAELPRVPEKRPIDALARGRDFKDAFAELPSFLQALYIEAFQSHLWNRTAHALLTASIEPKSLLATDDDFGPMLFPAAAAIPDHLRTLNLPLLAPSVELQEPWAAAAKQLLDHHALTTDALRIPGLRRPFFGKADRQLIVSADDFSLTKAEPDDLTPKGGRLKRTVAFNLPRGSYATVVLRALGQ